MSNVGTKRPPLPTVIWRLGWVSFWADVCSEMVYPIVPLYLAYLMAPPAVLGLIEGFAAALVSFMKGWSGFRSDKSGKRVPLVQAGYLLSGSGKPVIALAALLGWPAVFLGRSLDRFGKGVRTTARDALIADSVEKADYGRAYGFHSAMDTSGAFVGAIICYLLVARPTVDYPRIFLLAGIPGLLAWVITLRLRDNHPTSPEKAKPVERKTLDIRKLPPAYWRALGLCSLFALANSSDTFIILKATKSGFSFAEAILAYILYNFTYTLTTYPSASLSDKIGRWRLLGFGWVFYGLVYAGFAVLTGSWIWLLFALYGFYIGATDGVTKALVADLAPKETRGQAIGLFYMVSGFVTLAASLIAGILWQEISPSATFWFGSGCALLAALLIPMTARIARTNTESG